MSQIEKYEIYRKIGKNLNHKILDSCLKKDALLKAGAFLDMLHGDTFRFRDEDESSVLMDFAKHEIKMNDQSIIEIFRDKIGWENEIEKEIIDALLSSYTSLFRIVTTSEAEHKLVLIDLFNDKKKIVLTDVAFSLTATPGLLLFIRLLPFKDFNMTSGIAFVFQGNLEKYLLNRYKKLTRKIKSNCDSIKRFVAFYRLNKSNGIEISFL